MNLRKTLALEQFKKGRLDKVMVADRAGRLLVCGDLNDPGIFEDLIKHGREQVSSAGGSGTYLLITLDREVA